MSHSSGDNRQQKTYRRQQTGQPPAPKRRGLLVLCVGTLAVLLLALALTFIMGGIPSAYQPGDKPPGPPYVVALDAGHGGKDVGATGLIDEVELTEATVGYLYDLLDADPNYEPVLTRKLGEGASINERVRQANRKHASLLLSIHGNADESGTASGFECYPAPPGRTWHAESMRFAELLVAQMAAAGSPLRGEGGVRFAYYEGGTGETNKVFREKSDTTEYEAPSFGLVDKPDCPAVLAEQCFVTNAGDMERFGTEAGMKAAAACYYRAICEYYGTEPVG